MPPLPQPTRVRTLAFLLLFAAVSLLGQTPVPSAVSVTPISAGGSAQTFTFTFSDSQNAANITGTAMRIGPPIEGTGPSCSMVWDATSHTIQLLWDSGAGSTSRGENSSTVLSNSQCSLGAGSVTTSGLSKIITLAITFTQSFADAQPVFGPHNEQSPWDIRMLANDYYAGTTTGWVFKGNYLVAFIRSNNTVSPASGVGTKQTFTFTGADPQSGGNVTGMGILFANSASDIAGVCSIIWDGNAHTLQLQWDGGTGNTSRPDSSSTVLENSQCSVGAASVVASGPEAIITLEITFKAPFDSYQNYTGTCSMCGLQGPRNIYMKVSSYSAGTTTGYVLKGTYTIVPVPAVDSVTPNSGSGSGQSFSFAFSDSQDIANMTGGVMLIGNSPGTAGGVCYIVWDRVAQTIALLWDGGAGSTARPEGSSAPIENSQCRLGTASIATTALTKTLTLSITFKPAFNGARNIYMYSQNYYWGTNTGWMQKGSYTVSAP